MFYALASIVGSKGGIIAIFDNDPSQKVGRKYNDLLGTSTLVSRDHMEVKVEDGNFYLKDNSLNGTYIEGKKVPKGVWEKVVAGEIVSLGSPDPEPGAFGFILLRN